MKLAYVIGTYPSLTTTFIDREICLLRAQGVEIQVLSIRLPARLLSPEQEELREGVLYLLPASLRTFLVGQLRFALAHPLRYFGLLFHLLTRPHPNLASRWMTFLHFMEGVYAAAIIRTLGCDHIHAHFVDRAATVALVASRLLGIPYSVTAHARDIYVEPVLLPEKISGAAFVATCTGYNAAHLSALVLNGQGRKIKRIYHGLDTRNYMPEAHGNHRKAMLLAVGQLKEKKGLGYLLEACQLLKERGYEFECQIVGEGPLRPVLEEQIRSLGLEDAVSLCGALPHAEVIRKYQQAVIFVLPSVTAADGDRDGIPNVILEAMAMQLPVVSTAQSGIPEVVENGVNGVLVAPTDARALATALAQLLDFPELRRRLGEQGRHTVLENFDLERNVGQMLVEFQQTAGEG